MLNQLMLMRSMKSRTRATFVASNLYEDHWQDPMKSGRVVDIHVPPGYTQCEFPAGDAHAAREDLMQQAPTVWHTFAGTAQCLKPNLCPPCYAESVDVDEVDEVSQDTCKPLEHLSLATCTKITGRTR